MKIVTEKKYTGLGLSHFEGTLEEAHAKFSELRFNKDGSIRENLRFETDCAQDSDSELVIVWDRPETAKEEARRLRAEAKRKEKKQKESEARRAQEIKTFERLQAKYGPKSP